MPRFQSTNPKDPTDITCSPGLVYSADTNKAVPDSFAEWLAQPACDITAEAAADHSRFLGRLDEAPGQPPIRPCA
jgi:hypothetical protein